MSFVLGVRGIPHWLDALDAWPAQELWRVWRRTGTALLLRAAAHFTNWPHRARARRAWLSLSERDLQDLGMSGRDAQWEAGNALWRD